jgi:hypothetical protein
VAATAPPAATGRSTKPGLGLKRPAIDSPRELLNIFQADAIGCHIITVTQDILKKLSRP